MYPPCRVYTSVPEACLILMPSVATLRVPDLRDILRPCERASSRRGTQESRRMSVWDVRHVLVRRLSATPHAASLTFAFISRSIPACRRFSDPGRVQLCSHVFRRNRTAFHPNPLLSGHFTPAMIPGNPSVPPRQYLSRKPNHSPYLHENNHQTTNALFSFLYHGFRDSHFTRICRFCG
jgi:hypothetical protein